MNSRRHLRLGRGVRPMRGRATVGAVVKAGRPLERRGREGEWKFIGHFPF